MRSASGIELGPGSCVLVSAHASADGSEVSAVRVLEPAEWPGEGAALAATLKSIRKSKRFPRHARVVVWGLEKSGPVSDPTIREAVNAVVAAGFTVDAVLTPAEALAAVAAGRRRRNEGPIAWLSMNTHGAAIAIVHGSTVLFSKTLAWSYDRATQSVKAQLLQRYSFVTHIGPELKHAIERVRTAHGLKVETVVTCGDLPDLRSLTMPLIEELDIEVETLDSSDGLLPRGEAAQDRFAEWAPAIRLACAAAVAPAMRSGRWLRIPAPVAAAVLLATAAVAAYVFLSDGPVVSVDTRFASTKQSPKAAASAAPPEKKDGQPLPAVPPVTSIFVDDGRRLATIGGSIVGVGDRVGPRVVVGINRASVVLREPSGRDIGFLSDLLGVNEATTVSSRAWKSRQNGPVVVAVDMRDWEALFHTYGPD